MADVDLVPGPGLTAAGTDGRAAGGVVPRPELLERVGAARVTMMSAPAGTGKSVLMRCWAGQPGRGGRVAWSAAGSGERDPQRFWASVASALRATAAGDLAPEVPAAPDLDGWALVEQLLEDLAPLEGPLWLVVDDVHQLDAGVLRQLELLIMRAPPGLRFVLAARHDVRLGLHRLRLAGELAEIREPDLRFSLPEAEELFAAAGVKVPGPAVAALRERTEGWAAGLRLAALSMAGHPDPEGFAAEFSGSERTVAEYLLAEVLDRQPENVRRLLLRTSILERVNGKLADLLTGDEGGERALQDLERAGAFTVSLDASRTWFRYHQLFAGLLRLELRRSEPGGVAGLHRAAAGWFAGHGCPVEAVRHAQEAGDWELAARLLDEHGFALRLDGRSATVGELLARFPPGYLEADAGLAVLVAGGELSRGSLETAERYLDLARARLVSVPEDRRGQLRVWLAAVSLYAAQLRGNLDAAAEEAKHLAAVSDEIRAERPGLVADVSALAMINLGSAEFWAAGLDTGGHLEQGLALARRTGARPFLEFLGLAWGSAADVYESFERAAGAANAAVELARRHGWSSEPAFGVAWMVLGSVLFWQGRLDEAESWIWRAERTLRAETHPRQAMSLRGLRGQLELARGQDAEVLAAFRAADVLAAGRLAAPQRFAATAPALSVQAMVRLGDLESAGRLLAGLGKEDRAEAEVRMSAAILRLAQDDPRGALAELAPVLDRPARFFWQVMAHILEAAARDAAGDHAAADGAVERALNPAEPDAVMAPFLLYPVPPLLEAPSESEVRVLRYLPTHMSVPEIARELSVSPNTVKTHVRHLYSKLGTHGRAETVGRARALGLLAPSGRAARGSRG